MLPITVLCFAWSTPESMLKVDLEFDRGNWLNVLELYGRCEDQRLFAKEELLENNNKKRRKFEGDLNGKVVYKNEGR